MGAAGRVSIPHLVHMQAVGIDEARQRCPGLVVKPMRTARYREVRGAIEMRAVDTESTQIASEVHALLQAAAPGCAIEKASYDDYYIDATPLCHGSVPLALAAPPSTPNIHVWGGAWDALGPAMWAGLRMALDIRQALRSALGFTVSVGVARGRVGARLAGPLHKPDCVVVVPEALHAEFLLSQALTDVPSFGCVRRAACACIGHRSATVRIQTFALLSRMYTHCMRTPRASLSSFQGASWVPKRQRP